jgi:hypothetical protein
MYNLRNVVPVAVIPVSFWGIVRRAAQPLNHQRQPSPYRIIITVVLPIDTDSS